MQGSTQSWDHCDIITSRPSGESTEVLKRHVLPEQDAQEDTKVSPPSSSQPLKKFLLKDAWSCHWDRQEQVWVRKGLRKIWNFLALRLTPPQPNMDFVKKKSFRVRDNKITRDWIGLR